jgi:hypothetical protein
MSTSWHLLSAAQGAPGYVPLGRHTAVSNMPVAQFKAAEMPLHRALPPVVHVGKQVSFSQTMSMLSEPRVSLSQGLFLSARQVLPG